MKKIIALIFVVCALLGVNENICAQTTLYGDTVLGFSSEYSASGINCTGSWGSCKILGAPDVYPGCGDIAGSWAFYCTPSREWIEVGYAVPMNVDTIKIYQTNRSGAIDTIYFRDALTGNWNPVYSSTAIIVDTCKILKLGMPATPYLVDAVRLAILNSGSPLCYPEYDAIALIGSPISVSLARKSLPSIRLYPNPAVNEFCFENSKLPAIARVSIFTLEGALVASSESPSECTDISMLNSGFYFVSVQLKDGEVRSFKFDKR